MFISALVKRNVHRNFCFYVGQIYLKYLCTSQMCRFCNHHNTVFRAPKQAACLHWHSLRHLRLFDSLPFINLNRLLRIKYTNFYISVLWHSVVLWLKQHAASGFETRWGGLVFFIYVILPVVLVPGVYWASNRNESQTQENNVSAE
jgi:hypothetical protein